MTSKVAAAGSTFFEGENESVTVRVLEDLTVREAEHVLDGLHSSFEYVEVRTGICELVG